MEVELTEGEHLNCPFCGRDIISIPARKEILHEAPECSRFLQFVKDAGGDEGVAVEVITSTGHEA